MEDDNTDLPNEIAELIQKLCFVRPDPRFWDGLDESSLRTLFDEASAIEFHDIVPVWNLRPEALRFNDVAPEALAGAKLYIADRESFLSHCADAEIYCRAAFKQYSDGSQILKVIGQWLRGDALTPPLFFENSERKLQKVDGHHRTTVAFLAETPSFPFYCQDTLDLEGIERAPPELLEQSRWTAKRLRT